MMALQLTHLEKSAAKALCLEFILHEYASSLSLASSLSRDASQELWDKLYPALSPGLQIVQPGVLRKLCFYCEALLESSQRGQELIDVLDDLQAAALRLRRKTAPSEEIYQALQQFFPLLAPYFETGHHNETALFALLELRQTLNFHLGERTVETVLCRLFPEGPETMRLKLSSEFERRGFAHFCQQHEKIFQGLTWHPCSLKP